MKPLAIQDIARVLGGSFEGGGTVSAISTDTRSLPEGCLFLALTGERFDGNDYVNAALETAAAYAVASRPGEYPAGRVLLVEDTRAAYLKIAGFYRRSLPVKIAAVTGSVGKTTTQEMIACALSAGFRTLKTEANLNNEVGVSQTLLRLDDEHEAAVIELAMDAPGQIAPLSDAAGPDVGVVTNIGFSHLAAMGSRENIRDEKLAIRSGMRDGAPLILNGDDGLLRDVRDDRLNVIFYAIDNPDAAIRAERLREFSTHTTFEIRYDGNRFDAAIPSLGRHNVMNALAAVAAATSLGVPPQDAIAALKNYRPAGMRQNIVKHGPYTVVEDCYNASPDSMKAALDTIRGMEWDGRRIAILSDMLELGGFGEQAHREIGALAAHNGLDYLLTVGPLASFCAEGAREAGFGSALHFESRDELFAWLKQQAKSGDLLWFKASRGMRLEDVISKFYQEC
jgi:UDP-N-acetylmuramoyl-tripeptide--D-alanyl-D-alanine ligase